MRMMAHMIVLSASSSVFRGGKKRKLRLISTFIAGWGVVEIHPPPSNTARIDK